MTITRRVRSAGAGGVADETHEQLVWQSAAEIEVEVAAALQEAEEVVGDASDAANEEADLRETMVVARPAVTAPACEAA